MQAQTGVQTSSSLEVLSENICEQILFQGHAGNDRG